jgi:AcrR family transcriptional regulator
MAAERPAAPRRDRSEGEGEGEGKPYHHGDLRAALIQAGLAILAEEGAQALTLRAAARRAGVSHSAPYRHFADKEALLAAIAEEGFAQLADRLEQARGNAGQSPRAQLEDAGWAYVHFAVTHPDHLRVMFGSHIADPEGYPGMWAAGARAFAVLVEIIRTGQHAAALGAGDPQQLAFAAWAMVHGLALLRIDHQVPAALRGAYDQEQLVRLCLRQQYDGLGPHA